jgi:ketosteroid isomerase-like protein
MSTAKQLIREWMDLTAIGPAEAWVGKAAADVVVRLPYAPPGVVPEMRGFDAVRDTLSHHWGSKVSFDWHDVVILETEDPELFVTTARSEAIMTAGGRYANNYVMLTRVRDGLIVEHTEYFNPLPIVELLGRTG